LQKIINIHWPDKITNKELWKTRKLNLTTASSADRLRHNNVTLIFDLLTPKLNQFTFVTRRTNDKKLAKIHRQINYGDITETYSLGCMHGLMEAQTEASKTYWLAPLLVGSPTGWLPCLVGQQR